MKTAASTVYFHVFEDTGIKDDSSSSYFALLFSLLIFSSPRVYEKFFCENTYEWQCKIAGNKISKLTNLDDLLVCIPLDTLESKCDFHTQQKPQNCSVLLIFWWEKVGYWGT